MRALLALARGRGRRPGPPGDLRALRAEPLRFRRAPAIRMSPAGLKPITPWRALAPFFNLVLAHNRGAAFSFLADAGGWQRALFIGIAVAATGAIVFLLAKHSSERLFSTGLALVLGGALGNLWDRIALGHVVDFLDFHAFGWHFWAFNLADSAITVGAGLLILDGVRSAGAAQKP